MIAMSFTQEPQQLKGFDDRILARAARSRLYGEQPYMTTSSEI